MSAAWPQYKVDSTSLCDSSFAWVVLRIMLRILYLRNAAIAISFFIGVAGLAHAQWRMQRSGTSASLRGIHSVDGTVAWASGTHGTVLRTTDGGRHWQKCMVPPGAASLDFRSVWGWDADHAMVMSSGPGQQSRLYSTHDGCQTWRLVFTNPDTDGFWDALQFNGTRFGAILGDPVQGRFTLFVTYDGGGHWLRQSDPCLHTVEPQQGAFAASNQSMVVLPIESANSQPGFEPNHQIWFGTGGGWLYGVRMGTFRLIDDIENGCVHRRLLPTLKGPSAGIFALAFHDATDGVAVGGDYAKPQDGAATAAYTTDGESWHPSLHPPAGYRSTVAWNATDGSWIAAGPTGSDISRDGGKTWHPLGDGDWNAISLPFAVGPDGRMGRLISWGQLRADNLVSSHTSLSHDRK